MHVFQQTGNAGRRRNEHLELPHFPLLETESQRNRFPAASNDLVEAAHGPLLVTIDEEGGYHLNDMVRFDDGRRLIAGEAGYAYRSADDGETWEMMDLIKRIQDTGITILLVEHDMKLIMAVCQKIQVIDRGRLLTMGVPEDVRHDIRVIEAYLGKSAREKKDAQDR